MTDRHVDPRQGEELADAIALLGMEAGVGPSPRAEVAIGFARGCYLPFTYAETG
jgi:hypothetical protein